MQQDQQHLVIEIRELIDVANKALDGNSLKVEHDALVEIRTRLQMILKPPPTVNKVGRPRKNMEVTSG